MPTWIEQGIAEYTKRMPRESQIVFIEIKPENRSHRTVEQTREIERDRIMEMLPPKSYIIALDERGKSWNTQTLAQNFVQWQGFGRDISFVIGGADGLHADIKQKADVMLQLSSLTLPHGMVRVLLAEQLYRAWTITQQHPYHRS